MFQVFTYLLALLLINETIGQFIIGQKFVGIWKEEKNLRSNFSDLFDGYGIPSDIRAKYLREPPSGFRLAFFYFGGMATIAGQKFLFDFTPTDFTRYRYPPALQLLLCSGENNTYTFGLFGERQYSAYAFNSTIRLITYPTNKTLDLTVDFTIDYQNDKKILTETFKHEFCNISASIVYKYYE